MGDQRWEEGRDNAAMGMSSVGRVTTLAADLDDVTELRRQLRSRDERISALAAGGHLAWTTPPNGLADDMPLWRAFTGQRAAETRGWGWLEALHPDDRAHARQEWQRSVAERRVYEAEFRVRRADGLYRWFLTRAVPVAGEDGALREWAGSSIDITKHKRADEEVVNLLAVTDTAVHYLTDTTPQELNLAGLLGDLLDRILAVMDADNAAVLLTEADGQTLVLRAVRGPEAAVADRVRVPVGQGFAGRVAASGAPLVIDDLSTFDAVNPFLREQMRSAVGVPLLLHGRTVGVLHVAAARPRRFGDRDVRLLQRAAGLVALALDGARLFEQRQVALAEAEAARQEAEAANAELVRLQALTDTALSHLALEDLLRELLGRISAVMGVEDIGILLVEPDGQTMMLRAARGLKGAGTAHATIPVGQGVAGRVAATRTPLIVDDLASFDVYHPPLRAREQSAVAVPLLAEGRLLGVVYVGSATPRRFTDRDVQLLQRACDRIALAIDRARAYEDEQVARAEAERQAELLDRVFETVADGLVVYDTEGRIVRANATMRRTLGLDAAPPEYFQMSPPERIALVSPQDEQERPVALDDSIQMRALRGETLTGPDAMDARLRTLDGREVEVIISAAPLHDGEGRIVGAVASGLDVTERRRLEREREEARAGELAQRELNQRLDTFFAMAAHDLRAPASATKLRVQLAQRQLVTAAAQVHPDSGKQALMFAKVAAALQTTEHDLDRLLRLLKQLLDVSRARAGTLALERRRCDLGELVRERVEDQRLLTPERTLTLDLPSGQPMVVDADADRLGQVVSNYLSNAVRYSPEDQPIEVAVRAQGGRARVEVRDHGRGVAPEERESIWSRFQRAQSAREASGLGLGLYIARMIVELHDGRVGVESEPGQGSTFWCAMPLASGDAPSS